MFVSSVCVSCVCSGLCDGLITFSEESYQVCVSINLKKNRGDIRRIWALQEGRRTWTR